MENLSDLNVVGFIHSIQLYLQKAKILPWTKIENHWHREECFLVQKSLDLFFPFEIMAHILEHGLYVVFCSVELWGGHL